MFLAICFQKSTAVAHNDYSLCFSLLVWCHKTKMQTHYDPSMIMLAELQCACIMQLLCHSNMHEIPNWEGIQLFWTQLKSCSLWSIGISGLRSITQSSVSSNNINIAVIKCTHRNRKTWDGSSSWGLRFIICDAIKVETKKKVICNNI